MSVADFAQSFRMRNELRRRKSSGISNYAVPTVNCLAEDLEPRLLLATFRTIDGSDNNLTPQGNDFGVANTQLIRSGYPAFYPGGRDDDFGDQITRDDAPNPRDVSNVLSAQSSHVYSARNLSDWIVQWGQFLTHDMDLTGTAVGNNVLSTGATGDFSIAVNDVNDPLGPNPIPFNRSNYDPSTGNANRLPGPGGGQPNVREQINEITSFIDASNVYASDQTRANNLRTFVEGKLKTTAGGLLPGLNDVGEENDNAVGATDELLFLAGDVRANEQVGLTATHALFVREHNRLADLLKSNNPTFTDEEIYQWARKIVGAEMQIITYEEFLPALMGSAAPNPHSFAYAPNVDASITTSFAAAFFRFGHSQQSSTLKLVNNDGAMAGEFSLANIFFNADILRDAPTLVDQIMKGLASQVSQENDVLVVDEIRNFLFGPPGAGGLDLAALDIQRGRDHGLLDFNEFRRTYGLPALNSFVELTSDAVLQADLQALYENINSVDAWVGGIVEDHLPGASVGEMLSASFVEQFTRLRDGDRFFYTGDADLDNTIVTDIIDLGSLTLAETIRRNTGVTDIQDNVFFTAPGFSIVQTSESTSVTEDQSTDTFTVSLNSAPAANVVLTISGDDGSEATVDKTTLTFTPSNWHTPQVVTVTGVDDAVVDGDQASTIMISVSDAQSDDSFDQLNDQAVSVTTVDDDTPSLIVDIAEASITENGGVTAATVTRNSDTTNQLIITLTSSDAGEATVPVSVTIPAGHTTSPEFTIEAVEDGVVDGTQTVTITARADSHLDGANMIDVHDHNTPADLTATSFDAVTDHVRLGQTQVTFTIENIGNAAAGVFDTHVVWSPNDIAGDVDDIMVANSRLTFSAGLAAGATDSRTISLQLSHAQLYAHALAADTAGQSVGTVSTDISHLFLIVDVRGTVPESNEFNNFGKGSGLDGDDVTYFPWDADGNGTVTPREALAAMQDINTSAVNHDFDGNGIVTPLEALSVLQRIGYVRSESVVEGAAEQAVSAVSGAALIVNNFAQPVTSTVDQEDDLFASTVLEEALISNADELAAVHTEIEVFESSDWLDAI